MNAAVWLILMRGAAYEVVAEHDYTVDECTVLHSPERFQRFTTLNRGDLLSSQDRGDLFSRECD